MVGPRMQAAVAQAMVSQGNAGTSVPEMAGAIGNGSVLSLVGKGFNTFDSGLSSGAGIGAGLGLTGVSGVSVSQAIQAAFLQEFGMIGPATPGICDAIGQALEAELAQATLASSHSPVYAGSGTVIPGSILVSASEWASNVASAAPTFLGTDWPRFASAIGTGCSQSMATATGQVTITGAAPPSPVPFSGPNVVSPAGVIT